MTIPHHICFGRAIEARAAVFFLESFDATIVAQNYRCKGGEIDLILEQRTDLGIELVFVEIRGRSQGAWVQAVESVDFKKRMRLRLAIRRFLAGYQGLARSARLDILGWDGGKWTHLRNVWD